MNTSRKPAAGMVVNMAELRVLLAEDEAFARKLQLQSLGELGVTQFIIAQDGKEAISHLQSPLHFDLVVSDWVMPGASGIDVLRETRKSRPEAAFIMLTGRSDEESVKIALQARVDGYVVKPFSVQQLRLRILAAMRNAQRRTGQ
jgi:two-component system chemotaxis response regulator CheY